MIKPEERIILQDMEAFIAWSLANDKALLPVLATLGHDIHGVVNREECFSPRTAGYYNRIHSRPA